LEKIKWIKIKETKNENLIVEADPKGEGMKLRWFSMCDEN